MDWYRPIQIEKMVQNTSKSFKIVENFGHPRSKPAPISGVPHLRAMPQVSWRKEWKMWSAPSNPIFSRLSVDLLEQLLSQASPLASLHIWGCAKYACPQCQYHYQWVTPILFWIWAVFVFQLFDIVKTLLHLNWIDFSSVLARSVRRDWLDWSLTRDSMLTFSGELLFNW